MFTDKHKSTCNPLQNCTKYNNNANTFI